MMNHDALAIGSDTKPPILFPGEYSQWKDRFLDFVERNDYADEIMDSIFHGPPKPPMQDVPANPNADPPIVAHTAPKPKSTWTAVEKKTMKGDQLARSYLLMSIPNEIYMSIDSHKRTAKTMWEEIEKFMLGSKIGTQLKITNCISQYESFKAKEGEPLSATYTRFVHLINELSKNNIRKTKIENNVKFVSNLLPEWRRPANQIKHSKYLAELDLHEVYETLLQDEEEILETIAANTKKPADPIALIL